MRTADRLGICNLIGIMVLIFAGMVLFFIFADSSYRSNAQRDESRQLVRALGLTGLSLMPAGRALRDPAILNPAVGLRFDPKLGRYDPDAADFVWRVPD